MEQPGKEGNLDWNNHHDLNNRRRKLSETIYITTPSEEHNGNYDTEANTSYPKRNLIKKISHNLTRVCDFLSYSETHGYNYGEYPIGNEYRFRDWETW
jgi:hypothetical protein